MARRKQQEELDLGLDPLPGKPPELLIAASPLKELSPAQVEFNKRMKSLERARTAHEKERARLDRELQQYRAELLPLLERSSRAERDLVLAAADAHGSMKLTKRRKKWLGDLICGMVADLFGDPVGLDEEDLGKLDAVVEELGEGGLDGEMQEMEEAEFEGARGVFEGLVRELGIDLDLSGMDVTGDPAEFERELEKRFAAAEEGFRKGVGDETFGEKPKRKRKPTKAALERERKQREVEQAKERDLKTLYKQLAKVLHPDLETDPELKAHREAWMKRLTTARKEGDLREMLAIELEWLGEETGNLSKATDEKLGIYSLVLKEQAKEQREKTQWLSEEPQYQPLLRFRPAFGKMRPKSILVPSLRAEAERLEEMVAVLNEGGKPAKEMVNSWADAHARACGA